MRKFIIFALFLFNCCFIHATSYQLNDDPIDIVIPSTDKDLYTLDLCIEGIKKYCANVRRIIVISSKPLTDKAEWFDEKNYPFNKQDVAFYLLGCDQKKADEFLSAPDPRVGWYFQQLLKLYAPYVIPDISSNVLHLDSDTIFLNPVSFTNKAKGGAFNPGTEYHLPYFAHMDRLIPGLKKVFPQHSGISHHMLLQKPILDDLFKTIESYHKMDLWKAFCLQVDKKELFYSGASSDELYFTFAFTKTNQVSLRFLRWDNVPTLKDIKQYQKNGYHYISCHSWMR